MVEKDPTQGIELKETHAQRVSQRRCRIHFSESELRETNPRVFFVVCLTTYALAFYLYFRIDLLWCVVSVCAGTCNTFIFTCRNTIPSGISARARGGEKL